MQKIDPNLLTEQEWTGTFYPPAQPDLAFAGQLAYSPTDGVRLRFAIPTGNGFPTTVDCLHGFTTGGIPCTLVGNLTLRHAGFTCQGGFESHTADSGYPFSHIVFGDHVEPDEKFESYRFDFFGSQELFTFDASKRNIPFSSESLYAATTEVGTVEIGHSASFESAPRDLRGVLHCTNKNALEKLQAAYADLQTKYPDFLPMLKRTHDFSFHLKAPTPTHVRDACKSCLAVVDFFALVSYQPTRISAFSAIAMDEDGHPHALPVFPAIIGDQGVLDRCLEKREHHFLPLTMADFEFDKCISTWIEIRDQFDTSISMIQSQGPTVSPHETLSGIVVSVTQLESIGHQEGAVKDRYGHAIRRYGSRHLTEWLEKTLNVQNDQLGQAISDVRNDIAHVGRPKKYLNSLSSGQLTAIAHVLSVVIAGYILEKSAVTPGSRQKYQNNLTSSLRG